MINVAFTMYPFSMPHIHLFYERYKIFTTCMSTKRYFFSFCMPSHYLFLGPILLCTVVLKTGEYQLWFDIRHGAAGVLKVERRSINPMKNMFTGKQNVINPTIYQGFRSKTETSRNLAHICFLWRQWTKVMKSLTRKAGRDGVETSQGGSN